MPDPATTLLFQHPSRKVARTPLRRFLGDAAAKIAHGRIITCLITDDDRLRALNRQFRGQDYATDVLSFPAADAGAESVANGGELAISLDAAARQAEELGHTVDQELCILILHGILHLTGMDHETDAGEMARAEAGWRKRLGLPRGLIERSAAMPGKPTAAARSERVVRNPVGTNPVRRKPLGTKKAAR